MNKHGITVRERKTNKLVKFIECATGKPALRILGGIRINMSPDYRASEEFVKEEEVAIINANPHEPKCSQTQSMPGLSY